MQKKILLFLIILFFVLSCTSNAQVLSSLTPKDEAVTYQPLLILKGLGSNLLYGRVNGVLLDVKDESISCGLVLSPGKNFAKIEVWNDSGDYDVYSRKVLRLVSFSDVDALYNNRPHWAKREIITLATLGVIEGYPDNNFYVNKSVSRGELATWISKAKGLKTVIPDRDVFLDVPKEHWRAPYIKAVVEKGYMKGDSQGYFGIDMPVSRAEAALIALRVEGASFEKEIVSVFYDVPKTHPLYKQIKLAKAGGLVRGIHWRKAIYNPGRDMTRAEAVILISRFDRIKWLKKWLYSFKEGYNIFCRVNTPPKVKDVQITPKTFALGEAPPSNLKALIEDKEGQENILYVKADISQFNGPPDAEMRATKDEGEYALQFIASTETTGEKIITVTAVDKLGWQGSKGVSVFVVK